MPNECGRSLRFFVPHSLIGVCFDIRASDFWFRVSLGPASAKTSTSAKATADKTADKFPVSGLVLFLVSGFWLPVSGFWLLVSGLWFPVSGFRSLVSGLWFPVSGLWFLVSGLWSLVSGLRSLVSGLWSLVSGLWFPVLPVRSG
jgi:hypothetical protein